MARRSLPPWSSPRPAPGRRVVLETEAGRQELPPPATRVFTGALAGDPASSVTLSLHADGTLQGVVQQGDKTWGLAGPGGSSPAPDAAAAAAAAAASTARPASAAVAEPAPPAQLQAPLATTASDRGPLTCGAPRLNETVQAAFHAWRAGSTPSSAGGRRRLRQVRHLRPPLAALAPRGYARAALHLRVGFVSCSRRLRPCPCRPAPQAPSVPSTGLTLVLDIDTDSLFLSYFEGDVGAAVDYVALLISRERAGPAAAGGTTAARLAHGSGGLGHARRCAHVGSSRRRPAWLRPRRLGMPLPHRCERAVSARDRREPGHRCAGQAWGRAAWASAAPAAAGAERPPRPPRAPSRPLPLAGALRLWPGGPATDPYSGYNGRDTLFQLTFEAARQRATTNNVRCGRLVRCTACTAVRCTASSDAALPVPHSSASSLVQPQTAYCRTAGDQPAQRSYAVERVQCSEMARIFELIDDSPRHGQPRNALLPSSRRQGARLFSEPCICLRLGLPPVLLAALAPQLVVNALPPCLPFSAAVCGSVGLEAESRVSPAMAAGAVVADAYCVAHEVRAGMFVAAAASCGAAGGLCTSPAPHDAALTTLFRSCAAGTSS